MFAEPIWFDEPPLPADIPPSCPECGSHDVRIEVFAGEMDRETGYRDEGERGRCRECGYTDDPAVFEH